MKVHLLEYIDENHIGASIGETITFVNRKMKVTEVEIVDSKTHRLTLED